MTAGKERYAALDRAIARGLADASAGKITPAERVFDRLAAKYQRLARLHRNPD